MESLIIDLVIQIRKTPRPLIYTYISKKVSFHNLNGFHRQERLTYGHILLESMGETTKVTQVAYFDFFGASLWAHYPWAGGNILLIGPALPFGFSFN